jgi:thiol-disulfide isomerase/thioredoxin
MKKSIIFIALAVLCLFFKGYGQGSGNKDITPLLIGEKVPELVFKKIFNGAKQPISLSSLKGKAVILDFWGTWCSACIKRFPHMQDIQDRYGDHIQVILVGDSEKDTAIKIEQFLDKRVGEKREILLPVAYRDTLTKKLFPHMMYPHYVWIGADRRVKAITRAEQVTDENIERFITGLPLYLPKKEF